MLQWPRQQLHPNGTREEYMAFILNMKVISIKKVGE
jgi:hypothetical protein